RLHLTARLADFEKEGLCRHLCLGIENEAVALEAIDRGQWQPLCRENRPRAHRNDDGVAGDRFAIDLDASDPGATAHDSGNTSEPQFGATCLCSPHHRRGKLCWVDLSGGLSRA